QLLRPLFGRVETLRRIDREDDLAPRFARSGGDGAGHEALLRRVEARVSEDGPRIGWNWRRVEPRHVALEGSVDPVDDPKKSRLVRRPGALREDRREIAADVWHRLFDARR